VTAINPDLQGDGTEAREGGKSPRRRIRASQNEAIGGGDGGAGVGVAGPE
jgi:hypothetical protein